jgi:hypothetical protein
LIGEDAERTVIDVEGFDASWAAQDQESNAHAAVVDAEH